MDNDQCRGIIAAILIASRAGHMLTLSNEKAVEQADAIMSEVYAL